MDRDELMSDATQGPHDPDGPAQRPLENDTPPESLEKKQLPQMMQPPKEWRSKNQRESR